MYKPIEGAKKALKVNLGVRPKETVFIIAEESTSRDAKYFLEAGKELDIDITMITIPELNFNGEEPSGIVRKVMRLPNSMILATKNSLSTTNARIQASNAGVRIFNMPSFSKVMLTRGPIEADFKKIKPKVWALADLISKAEDVKITTNNGSNLKFSIKGREGRARDALCEEPGSYRSMSVEANTAPLEDSANGILMVDLASPTDMMLDEPVKITFKDGFIVKIEGKENAVRLQEFFKKIGDKNIFCIAEIGIGLNPASKLTGNNYIEDESAIGTAHVGIGRNTGSGGKNKAKGHFDLIFKKPDIFFDNTCIMKDGQLEF